MPRSIFPFAAVLLVLAGAASAFAQSSAPSSSAPSAAPTPASRSLLGTSVPLLKPPPGSKPNRPAHPTAKAKPGEVAKAKPHAVPPKAPPKAAAPATAPATPAPAAAPPKADPTKGTETGLKLPRWVALRSDEVNLRTGPGMQYPIDWQYHRRDLPVRVLREYDAWRLVEMQDTAKGWVHKATLTGRRGFLVVDAEKVLRATADDAAAAVARLQPGVVGHIRACDAGQAWCDVQIGDYRGWLRRSDMWGIDPDEAIN